MDKPNETKEYLLVNITEELVRRKVKSLMAAADMCCCDKCYYDVCALILNNMPPQYVTTEKGKLLSLLNTTGSQFQTNLVVHATQAIEKVRQSPMH
jgi:competence protein ComFB